MSKMQGANVLLDFDIILSKSGLIENMKVADLGCGTTGHFVFPAARMIGEKGKVYAVDIMKPVLESINRRARQENLLNVKTVWSNLEKFNATEIESSSLDVALLINTLYQSHKRVEILREALRMLKRGGVLTIVDWKRVKVPFGPPIEERVEKQSLINASGKLGIRMEKEFFVGPYHYGLIFTKI
jgi:ubiquinone/menaquinone biosynthesis C-methylase UbiE